MKWISLFACAALLAAGCGDIPGQARAPPAPGGADTDQNPTIRRVWATSRDYASPSPDGRLITYVDWSTGDVAVHDLAAGEDRRLTDKGSWEHNGSWAEEPLFSPDGSSVVYSWGNTEAARPFVYELRIVELGDTTPRLLLRLTPEDDWIAPVSWHPTAGILARRYYADGRGELLLVSPTDGSSRVVRSFTPEERSAYDAHFSPDGRFIAFERLRRVYILASDGSGERDTGLENARLLGWSQSGASFLFHGQRGDVRGIWAQPVANGRASGEPVLVRAGIPHLVRAGVAGDAYFYAVPVEGPRVYMAAVDVEHGRLLMQPTALTSPGEGFGESPAWSPDGRSFAYVLRGEDTKIMLRSTDSDHLRELTTLPERMARNLVWDASGESIYLISNGVKGPALFRIDVRSGVLEKQFEPAGRTFSLSPDGRSMAISRGAGVVLRDLRSGEEREVASDGPNRDVAFSPDGRSLAIVRRDSAGSRIAVVELEGGAEREIYRAPEGRHLEAVSYTLAFTADGRHVLSVLGDDEQRHWISAHPVAGGESHMLIDLGTRPDGPEQAHARLHPDGRRIIYSTGYPRSELWVMEGIDSMAP